MSTQVSFGSAQPLLEVKNVSKSFGTLEVLNDINLSVKKGEVVCIIGPSGSGKSTLVNLICRFYDVSSGSIALDGRDIRSIGIADYRKCIGLVLQEPFLFFGTIAENIAYGKPEASRDEIIAAARAAHAHEFILRLPQGYDSLVGERGQGLFTTRHEAQVAEALARRARHDFEAGFERIIRFDQFPTSQTLSPHIPERRTMGQSVEPNDSEFPSTLGKRKWGRTLDDLNQFEVPLHLFHSMFQY